MDKRKSNGQFAKNNSGKPKGATSKKTSEIRESFQLLIENNLDKLEDDLSQLKPKERLDVIMNLANYILPKLKATDMRIQEPTEVHFFDFNEAISFKDTGNQGNVLVDFSE